LEGGGREMGEKSLKKVLLDSSDQRCFKTILQNTSLEKISGKEN
jgi:hypothetical protein